MRISIMAALSRAKARQPLVEADQENTPSVTSARALRLSRDATHSTIALRCLTPADAHHITDLLQRLSPHSRYRRYFRLISSFAPADIARFVAITADHLAVGAFDGNLLVGVAQYFRFSDRPEHAEVAVEVADSHHRRRVGARLVHELARLAADDGITHFTATVLAENRPVLELMRRSGWDIAATADGSYTDVVVTLPPELVGAAANCDRTRRAG